MIRKLQSELDQSQLLVESDSSDDDSNRHIASSCEFFVVVKNLRDHMKTKIPSQIADMETSPDNFVISYEEAQTNALV